MPSSEIFGRFTGDRAKWFSEKLEVHEFKQYSVVDKNLVYTGPIDKHLVATLLFLYYEYLEPGAISGWFISNRRIEDIPFESAGGKIIRLSIHLDGSAKLLTIRAPAYLKLTCKQQGKSVASASYLGLENMHYIGAHYVSSVGRLSMFFENKTDALSALTALTTGRSTISFYGDLSVDGYKISDIENSKKVDVSDQVLLYNPDNTPATEGGSRGFSDSSEYDFELLGPISSGIARHPSPGGGSYAMGSSAHTHMPIYRNDTMRMSNTLYQPHGMNHNHSYTQLNNMFQHHFNDNMSHSSHLSQPIGSMGMMPAFNAQHHQYNPYTQFNNIHQQQQYMNLHHKRGRQGDLDFQQYDPSTARHTGQSSKQSSSKKTSLKHSSKKQIESRQKKQTKKQSLLAPIKEKLKQKRSLQKDEDYYKKRDREYFSSEGEPSDGESLGSDDDDEEEDDHPNDEDKNFVVDEDDVDDDYVDEDEYKPPKRKNSSDPPPKKRRTRSSDVESDGTDLEEIDENDVEDLNDEVEDMDTDEAEDDTDEVDPDDDIGIDAENTESE